LRGLGKESVYILGGKKQVGLEKLMENEAARQSSPVNNRKENYCAMAQVVVK
jgi:hypothetical protein